MQISGRSPVLSALIKKRSIRFGFRVRLGGAGDDQQLVDVGDEDVLPAAGGAAEHGLARLDPLDDALVGLDGPKHDTIAGGHDVALVGG